MCDHGYLEASVILCLLHPIIEVARFNPLYFKVDARQCGHYHVWAIGAALELLAPARDVPVLAQLRRKFKLSVLPLAP